MARPPKPADERRSDVLQLRFTPPERATLEAAAATAGVLLSEFIRGSALEDAAKVKKPRRRGGAT